MEYNKNLFLNTYNRLPIVIEKAMGNLIYGANGSVYKDYISGIGVNILGHTPACVLEAVEQQCKRYMHVSNYFEQDVQSEFLSNLLDVSGFDAGFLCNSGTECTEGAIKLCRLYGNRKHKYEVRAFHNCFHGRSYGALSLMRNRLYRHKMGPYLQGMRSIKFNDSAVLRKVLDAQVSAVFVEFIQGEGGVRVASEEFVATLKELKEEYGFLIVADEVQTGMGRTGKFFAHQYYDIAPDIVLIAKGVGGGLPLGAILVREHLRDVFSVGQHGTTFGGNSVSCAAGSAVLRELRASDLMDNAAKMGERFMERLRSVAVEFPLAIVDVRGLGLMIGIELRFEGAVLVKLMLERHKIITNCTSKNVIRLLPPLCISDEDVWFYVNCLRDCLLFLSCGKYF
ncbi:MAG: acetylornithine transaminase [Ignavibacteria bacterium]|jgi:acetylornithine/succinyldiaminopimelate/putrescine aminotransferase|nr:acetylornithine transaminase [Ignavibacteria bacterium]